MQCQPPAQRRRRPLLRHALAVLCLCGLAAVLVYSQAPLEVVRERPAKSAPSPVSLISAAAPPALDTPSQNDRCDFSSDGGEWGVIGTVSGDGDGDAKSSAVEHILHWLPRTTRVSGCGATATERAKPRTYRRFDQASALRCLQGKHVLFYGNSNTRTLYIALEALLRDKPMTSRVAAKQLCDNSRHNRSCWETVSIPPFADITMRYISYVQDLYHPELERKIPPALKQSVDVVVGNSGLNGIQLLDDGPLFRQHTANAPQLRSFVRRFASPGRAPAFVWHTTTPVCPNQPHFKRYLYNAKHWRHRSLEHINQAVQESNRIVLADVFGTWQEGGGALGRRAGASPLSDGDLRVFVLDDWAMAARTNASLCPYFEDPLHHRFLDREVVQLFLNSYCGP